MARFNVSRRNARQRPEYERMLAGILVLYAVIIGFGDAKIGGPVRVGIVAFLVWSAARLRRERSLRLVAIVVGLTAVVATILATIFATPRLVSALVGLTSVVLIGTAMWTLAGTLRGRLVVDTSTVLGVLCIYLLLGLFFGGLHQLLGAFINPYVNGASNPPSSSDMLYFSVITLTTVGFGDITPVSEVARAVTVIEALTGQLYLVSVVAAVVGGWRGSQHSE
jgi:hypothetical protein